MNILIYYQNPSRTIFLESLVQEFIGEGHKVFFLTFCERGPIHDRMETLGATVSANPLNRNRILWYIGQISYLIKYCRKNKIDVVYSHLQIPNFIALMAKRFIRAKVYPCRHHIDEVAIVGNRNGVFVERQVNRMARKLIVVSNGAKTQMVNFEKVDPGKIAVIPLGYNFDLYDRPDVDQVKKISQKMPAKLLMIVIARMSKDKRHIVILEVLKRLRDAGFDTKLLLLGDGTERKNLEDFVSKEKLGEHVHFTGQVSNVMDYLAAADILLNPSIIEASNQVVKEAAILGKPSIVCEGVGDFSEYIIHRENGFLVSKEKTAEEMFSILKEYYDRQDQLEIIGANAREEVSKRFDIKKVSRQYLELAE